MKYDSISFKAGEYKFNLGEKIRHITLGICEILSRRVDGGENVYLIKHSRVIKGRKYNQVEISERQLWTRRVDFKDNL